MIAPDLAVTNIAFSNPQPIEGEAVTINATVHNNGTANAADVTVQFFDGTPANGTQIGTDQTIATLNAGENKTGALRVSYRLGVPNFFRILKE